MNNPTGCFLTIGEDRGENEKGCEGPHLAFSVVDLSRVCGELEDINVAFLSEVASPRVCVFAP